MDIQICIHDVHKIYNENHIHIHTYAYHFFQSIFSFLNSFYFGFLRLIFQFSKVSHLFLCLFFFEEDVLNFILLPFYLIFSFLLLVL